MERFKTKTLNDWAKTEEWRLIRHLKIDDYSNFACHFRRAEAGHADRLATVKFIDDLPIGLAVFEVDGDEVNFEVYVRPDLRRRGHASSLFKYVARLVDTCMIYVSPWDHTSQKFFESVGVDMKTEAFETPGYMAHRAGSL